MFELSTPVLELRNVSYRVRDTVLLTDISLALYPGEILCIVGGSGAGKSTVLKVAAGLLDAQQGSVEVRVGQDTNKLSSLSGYDLVRFRRKHFGYVQQDARDTLNMGQSIGANIARPLFDDGVRNLAATTAAVRHWCQALQLDPRRLQEKPATLSGGMLQRVQIAKAMVHRPEIILLDEPTTGLDTAIQATLLSLLSALQRESGVAMILVTHDLRIARLMAHRVVVIDEGRIVEEATPDRLIVDPQHLAAKRLVGAMI